MKIEEGRARLESVIDDTVAAVLPEELETTSDRSPSGTCEQEGQVNAGYGYRFSVEGLDTDRLFQETEKFWTDRGFQTRTNLNDVLPALFATDEGFSFSLQVSPEKKRGWIEGSTPCLDE